MCSLRFLESSRPQADSFKIAGPLIPQCVISKGPSLCKTTLPFWPITLTLTCAETPGRSKIL